MIVVDPRSTTPQGLLARARVCSVAVCGLAVCTAAGCSVADPRDACHHDHIGSQSQAVSCSGAPPARSFSSPIDPLASYDPQSTCDPTAKAGVKAFRDLILATYPCTGDFGIERACNVGGTSEHKEGRAWDWKVAVGNQAADDLLAWLLAPDAQGNTYAMVRRLGVMYIVWNKKIWGAYRPQDGWRAYSGNPHTDHVHFSFSWAGANKTTSYWGGQTLPLDSGVTPTPDSAAPSPDGVTPPPDQGQPSPDQATTPKDSSSVPELEVPMPWRDSGAGQNARGLLIGGCAISEDTNLGSSATSLILALLALAALRRCAGSQSKRRQDRRRATRRYPHAG